VPQEFNLQESWKKGLQHPLLIMARLGLDVQNYAVRYYRNQMFPQLDAIGSYGYNASSKEFSGAFDQVGRGQYPFYTFGAQITIPLSLTAERNNYKAQKAGREKMVLSVKQMEQGKLIGIENSIGNARSAFQSVDATREARLYAEAALEAEQKKLENGKSTSFIVLQLQKNLTDARSAEIGALRDYNNALAALAYEEGTTLERRHVDVVSR
jgi:outer membrane protein